MKPQWTLGTLGILLAAPLARGQVVVPSTSERAAAMVGTVMRTPSLGLGFWHQQGAVLGDAVAVALTKSLRLTDFRDPGKAEKVLTLMGYAFAEPSSIEKASDRRPRAALLLLDLIVAECPDPKLRTESARTTLTLEGIARGPRDAPAAAGASHDDGRDVPTLADATLDSAMRSASPVEFEPVIKALGDDLAIASARSTRLRYLADADRVDRILLLLDTAFADPVSISSDAAVPSATLLILDCLSERGPDSTVRGKAAALVAKMEMLAQSLRGRSH